MTDLTPTLNTLLAKHRSPPIPSSPRNTPSTSPTDEFLKEAYRINTHIRNLTTYLRSIRPSYLSLNTTHKPTSPSQRTNAKETPLTDPARDQIDTSTSLLLHDLSTSISTLSSAESLRHETATRLLQKKYGQSAAGRVLSRWAAGGSSTYTSGNEGKSKEQVAAEEEVRVTGVVRESVVWFLRRGLEGVISLQREMVERRIERVVEKERSVLFMNKDPAAGSTYGVGEKRNGGAWGVTGGDEGVVGVRGLAMEESEVAAIEAELSPEQLQLFEEENEVMVRYYEDTLSKVQNAEKSLLEISSLQQTLVSHLATQEEYIGQLIMDVGTTDTNIGRGNKELKRASERRSTAQAVFWGTVGLCTSLIVWDLIF
ncbi:hypothetical protein BBP40_008208 [Aspergillus hancockii]|nr:hypothetical protein BBP40_008208 [Aspergillus hancockii]